MDNAKMETRRSAAHQGKLIQQLLEAHRAAVLGEPGASVRTQAAIDALTTWMATTERVLLIVRTAMTYPAWELPVALLLSNLKVALARLDALNTEETK